MHPACKWNILPCDMEIMTDEIQQELSINLNPSLQSVQTCYKTLRWATLIIFFNFLRSNGHTWMIKMKTLRMRPFVESVLRFFSAANQILGILWTNLDVGVDFITLGSHSKCSYESSSVSKPGVEVKLTCQHLTAGLEGGITRTLETSNQAELLFTLPFSQRSVSQPCLRSQIFMSVQPVSS